MKEYVPKDTPCGIGQDAKIVLNDPQRGFVRRVSYEDKSKNDLSK